MDRRARFRPRPFEVVPFAAVAAIALGLRAQGLPIGVEALRYIVEAVLHRLPELTLAGLAVHLLAHAVRRRSPLPWLRALVAAPSLGLWVRLWVVLTAVTFGYSWLKVCVPLLRDGLLDARLWALDQALHFGLSPTVLTVELVAGTPLAGALDVWYALWLSCVLVFQSAVFVAGDLGRRRNFALACGLLWLAGSLVYLALPAVGPCFAAPEVFDGIRDEMPRAARIQARLWGHYQALVAPADGGPRVFRPFLAVAALPSLHVGAHWLFALWSKRHAPRLQLPFVVATGLTFVGSLATGWHYALDGYAGMLLAWGAVRIADRLEPAGDSGAAARGQNGVGEQQSGDQRDRDQQHAERGLDPEHHVPLEQ